MREIDEKQWKLGWRQVQDSETHVLSIRGCEQCGVWESEEKRAGVARSSREKIYYQIKFLTGDIALSFRFGRAFVRSFCTFDAILRLLQDHLLHIPFDSFAISDCSMCTNKIYFLFAYRALFYHFFSLVPQLLYRLQRASIDLQNKVRKFSAFWKAEYFLMLDTVFSFPYIVSLQYFHC